MMREDYAMKFEDLAPELQEKAKSCKTWEEIKAVLEEEGIALSEGMLEGFAGGMECPPLGLCLSLGPSLDLSCPMITQGCDQVLQ